MHKCPKCNEEVRPNEIFCHNCGERLVEVTYDKQKQTKAGKILFLIMTGMLLIGFIILVSMDFYYIFNTTHPIEALDITSISVHMLCALVLLSAFVIRLGLDKVNYLISQSLTLCAIFIDYLYHAIFMTINNCNFSQVSLAYIGMAITLGVVIITSLVKDNIQLKNITLKTYAFVIAILTIFQSEEFLDVYYLADVYWLGRNFIDIGTVMLLFYSSFGVQVIKRIRSRTIYVEDKIVDFYTLNDGNVIDNEVIAETKEVKDIIHGDKEERVKRIKELLDIGAITKEEFEAKKKEILGGAK